MYSATFIFTPKQYDAEFEALDAQIAAAAKASQGYLGEESWEDPKTGRIANVYYWASEAGLRELMAHPQHLAAKQRYQTWLGGYQVIIAQVLRTYGDGALSGGLTLPNPAAAG
ncbi:antibiotic biosynthesis monooxygenase family protein [Chitinibacter tainanensis]|uniref:antibiotic biosynthesis monooxygenase family protein n=1 Tax=Chitinibacter tainanensis TaxID=230667 RepID=UPI0003FDDB7F|nr:antibiotic biosynthesis monooxygenase [Chitinibacter tainanensis]